MPPLRCETWVAFLIYNLLALCLSGVGASQQATVFVYPRDVNPYKHPYSVLSQPSDYKAYMDAGITQFIFTGDMDLYGSGDLHLYPNATYIQSISKLVGDRARVLLCFSHYYDSNLPKFRRDAQALIDATGAAGVLFGTYMERTDGKAYKYWRLLNKMMASIRSLKGRNGRRALTGFWFDGFNPGPTFWLNLKKSQPWLNADYAYALIFSVDEVRTSYEWARDIADRFIEASGDGSKLSFILQCYGYSAPDASPFVVRRYYELIQGGADPRGNGTFNGTFFHSPYQIERKATIVDKYDLLGMGVNAVDGDLPPTNPLSMVRVITRSMSRLDTAGSLRVQ
ncbi:hypothetical protein FOL47_001951 [Perkinsus chesapeaki]|uniref:Chitinase n=1 Tax=Perkinsus chesapeaki TaxID=330153 RepID=A0A7J6N0J2_PERCH|nr:hypothetical protein FOL47_001951 [Perkinsus chesapeaki]